MDQEESLANNSLSRTMAAKLGGLTINIVSPTSVRSSSSSYHSAPASVIVNRRSGPANFLAGALDDGYSPAKRRVLSGFLQKDDSRAATPSVCSEDSFWDAPVGHQQWWLKEEQDAWQVEGRWHNRAGFKAAHLESPCPLPRPRRPVVVAPVVPVRSRPTTTRIPQPTFSLGCGRNRPGFRETGRKKKMAIRPSRIPKRVF